jgi:hypothetical protein
MAPQVGFRDVGQADFSAGMVRSTARHMIPRDGAYTIAEGMLDDDGAVYRRGAISERTLFDFGADPLTYVQWASFSAGERVMIGSSSEGFGVLDEGIAPPVQLDASADMGAGAAIAQIGEIAFFPIVAGANYVGFYAGARLPLTPYATGTITAAEGSVTITGAETSWLASAEPGTMVLVNATPPFVGVVKEVVSDTEVTLVDPWQGPTGAGLSYSMRAFSFYREGVAVAAVANRLLVALGRKLAMSKTIDPDTGQPRPFEFDEDSYHEFPGDIIALGVLRDVAYVFTMAGVYAVSGLAFDVYDSYGNFQQNVQRISGELVARSNTAVTTWRDSLVIAALDGVYALSTNGIELLSRSVTALWQTAMAQGARVGQMAAFRDHLFVPLTVGSNPLYTLVARLDRRVETSGGRSAPWTMLGEESIAGAYAVTVQDPTGQARLLACARSSPRVWDFTTIFDHDPEGGVSRNDGDSNPVVLTIETRDFTVAGVGMAFVRNLLLDYEAMGVVDGLTFEVSAAERSGLFEPRTWTLLAGTAGENIETQKPVTVDVGREARRLAVRVTTGGGVLTCALRGITLRVRDKGRFR